MYCSKCGEADQSVNSYCRKCGDFLIDNLSKFSLINQILGIDSPKKQITIGLVMNIIGFVVSLALIPFLMGYMAGVELAGKSSPNMTDIYILLGANAVWQLINVIFSANLMIKMNRTSGNIHQTSDEMNAELTNLETKDILPPADLQNVIPSVVEETTRNLEKVRRK
jgi:uncharacterized membrane protein YuzA (DUF378 family)